MKKIGFDNDKYLSTQSENIKKRISKFGGKLYLEFGGKLFDDYHASRVLPGFKPDSKLQMLLQLKDQAEIVIAINANDIEKNKVRGDIGITYDLEILRLIDAFKSIGLYVGSVVFTQYQSQPAAHAFKKRLLNMGVDVYRHYPIEGYPSNIPLIVSDDGFGKNEYIHTTRELVVITAPGPGSGKMATCLSQLYHDNKRGIKSGYAKFETFPVWNLPINHPVNLAYEAATADLDDVNMLDPYHLEAYGEKTVNYNRDVEVFPVLNAIFKEIYGESPYKSPTDMGVNMVGNCIIDDEACIEASNQEIIRRYYKALCDKKKGDVNGDIITKLEVLLSKANLSADDREVIAVSLAKSRDNGGEPATAIELPSGHIVSGKTTDLLGSSSSALLNALKELAGIDDAYHLIPPNVFEPIQALKTKDFGSKNPRLHSDETLIALSIAAATDENAAKALRSLPLLRGCEAHTTVIVGNVDMNVYKKLGINLTCEPEYQTNSLYHH